MALLAVDLVRKGVDVIVTAGTPATVVAKQATPTIPIVFAVAGAPVEKGLVDSLAHPGGNVTGLALIMDVVKALEILKEAAPKVSRVAFIYDPSGSGRVRGGLAELSSGQVTHSASGLAARHLAKTA
jgi:putative tryptophan/tyrosine transport system substrate-binding protein